MKACDNTLLIQNELRMCRTFHCCSENIFGNHTLFQIQQHTLTMSLQRSENTQSASLVQHKSEELHGYAHIRDYDPVT